jgi:FxsC-like protein
MAYDFFLSYTRANNDAYLKQFFDSLCEVIRERRGLPQTAEVGFFDQRDLELGEDWDNTIVEALQTSRVFVAISSPGYFNSEYCGKEWAIFAQRCAAAKGAANTPPPLLKPIIWVPLDKTTVPPAFQIGQFKIGDPQELQNTKGFKYILKQLQEYRKQYVDLIELLATEILAAGHKHDVPRLAHIPSLRGIPSAFATGAGVVAPAASQINIPTGPKHVRFVYIAADPKAFGSARQPDPYLDCGGSDWKPFFPKSTTRVHRLVQHVVTSDDLDFTSDELPFGPELLNEIDKAWAQRQIVLLIVDPWSLHWSQTYRKVLMQLDQRLDYHWCVLVPRNANDQDSLAIRSQIERALSSTFDRHANLAPNPMFYRGDINSADELKTALREVVTRLKEEIKKRASVDMPVPVGPPRLIVTGPSGE